MGRIDHVTVGNQVAADPERVAMASKILQEDFLEVEAGDAAFFHSNLLHRSDQNK